MIEDAEPGPSVPSQVPDGGLPLRMGFPVHAVLAAFPLGVFAASVLFDLASHRAREIGFARPSFWLLCLGIVSGLVAGVSGLRRALRYGPGTSERRIALRHTVVTDLALALFAASAVARRNTLPLEPVALAPMVLSLAGMALLVAGFVSGVRLAYRPILLADQVRTVGRG